MEFVKFKRAVHAQFNQLAAGADMLFLTNVDKDQPCAYGILIHSMWGEESEDKVFEEYKRINNLML